MINPFPCSDTNKRFHSVDYDYKRRFGRKTVKIPLNAGLNCPNRDGTCSTGGCIYCSGVLSGEFAGNPADSLANQFEKTKALYKDKWKDFACIAYLQAGTNTHADVKTLERIYNSALSLDVVGLSIATRADCIDTEKAELLADVSQKTFLTVELGLQTASDVTAKRINRGHTFDEFLRGYDLLRQKNINVGIHIINGLPGETYDDMMDTVRKVSRLAPNEVKIHLLHVIESTPLAEEYRAGGIRMLEKDEYISLVCDQLEELDPRIAIGRLTGDGDKRTLIAPKWSMDKRSVLNGVDMELAKRNSYQGIRLEVNDDV